MTPFFLSLILSQRCTHLQARFTHTHTHTHTGQSAEALHLTNRIQFRPRQHLAHESLAHSDFPEAMAKSRAIALILSTNRMNLTFCNSISTALHWFGISSHILYIYIYICVIHECVYMMYIYCYISLSKLT